MIVHVVDISNLEVLSYWLWTILLLSEKYACMNKSILLPSSEIWRTITTEKEKGTKGVLVTPSQRCHRGRLGRGALRPWGSRLAVAGTRATRVAGVMGRGSLRRRGHCRRDGGRRDHQRDGGGGTSAIAGTGAVGVASVTMEGEPPPPRLPSRGTKAIVRLGTRERRGEEKDVPCQRSAPPPLSPPSSGAQCVGRRRSLAVYRWGWSEKEKIGWICL
jgi:hypothetical protein